VACGTVGYVRRTAADVSASQSAHRKRSEFVHVLSAHRVRCQLVAGPDPIV
jgi:hypothetical protein